MQRGASFKLEGTEPGSVNEHALQLQAFLRTEMLTRDQDTTKVWYCSSECQKKDWIKHKPFCKEAQARQKANAGNTMVQKPVQHHCANCGSEASLNCKECKDAPNNLDLKNLVVVWYCGVDYQKQHWTVHKTACKAAAIRRQIYRAAVILQDVFYTFNRTTNMLLVDRIQKENNTWFLHPPKTWEGKSRLISFPPACVKTAQEEKALLGFRQCHSALFQMHDLIKRLLQDYCSEILEVTFRVKNPCFRLHMVYVNNIADVTDFKHAILKFTLNNGEQYALDLTGAQYGWTESIMPWNLYAASRIQDNLKIFDFGYSNIFLCQKNQESGESHARSHQIIEVFIETLSIAIHAYERYRMPFQMLLELPEEKAFKSETVLLRHGIQDDLKKYKEKCDRLGSFTVDRIIPGAFDRSLKPFISQ